MGSGSCSFVSKHLLATALAASLILTLAQPAQTREETGIVTIQAVEPKTPTVGQPLTFAVVVENNAVAQRVAVEDFLPLEVSLVSAKPSQGTCHIRRDGASGRESVGCDLGVVQRESMAEVEIVVTPEVAGSITNTAVAAAEFSPATPANSSSATVRVKPGPVSGDLVASGH
jgi:uncharacterized repeat protein (TIGR01451 family)